MMPYVPSDEPKHHLEIGAARSPMWARLAAWHHDAFPHKRTGRVQRALKRWGARRTPRFTVRVAGVSWLVDLRHQPNYATYQSAVAIEGADEHFIDAVNALVRADDFVLDVGANRGYFAILTRRRVGARGRVVAVEPVELTRRFLSANLRLNQIDDVLICPVGVSDEAGEAQIAVNPSALGCSSLHPKEEIVDKEGTVLERIELRRLDDLVEELDAGRSVDVVKIDVEGHELPALRGATNVLATHPLVLFEAWPSYEQISGFSLSSIEETFLSCGPYRFAAIAWRDGKLIHLPSPLRFENFSTLAADLVAWIPGKHDDRIAPLVRR